VSAWRHVRAIALLPGTVTVMVPAALLLAGGTDIGWGLDGALGALPPLVGSMLIVIGFALWAWTVQLLARIGRGTLAPWDPTKRLVVEGPYRHVRNPMISAVLIVLLGEAAFFGSTAILVWWAAFLAVNYAFLLTYEEPALERRFGDDYRAYRRSVSRWLPRRKPWATHM
jgi:protein-S-isoprenylcysteine O-methyltransferase Ste14